MKTSSVKVLILLSMIFCGSAAKGLDNQISKIEYGYVSDKEAAIKIALSVWELIYGHKQIANQAPYVAELKNTTWYVSGTLPGGWKGGVANIEIEQETGKVLMVSHGK